MNTIREFVVAPFDGAIPIRFGMTPAEVAAMLGKPSWSFRDGAGILVEERADLYVNVGYAERDQLNEAVFAKGAVLKYEGKNLLRGPDPVSILRRYSTGYKWLGSVVFPSIGLMCTAIEQVDDEMEWTISVAMKGRWDAYQEDFVVLP